MSVPIRDVQLKDLEVAAIRHEIVESQKVRIDLLKYKLVAVAALGAIGIGVYHADPGILRPDFVLTLIPFICVYVDSVCWHNTLRILVIAQFLLSYKDKYEGFLLELGDKLKGIGAKELIDKGISEGRKNNPYNSGVGYFFRLEDWALQYSTIIICVTLIAGGAALLSLGIANYYTNGFRIFTAGDNRILLLLISELQSMVGGMHSSDVSMIARGFVFIATALFGLFLSIYINRQYKRTVDKLGFGLRRIEKRFMLNFERRISIRECQYKFSLYKRVTSFKRKILFYLIWIFGVLALSKRAQR